MESISIKFTQNLTQHVSGQQFSQKVGQIYGISPGTTDQTENAISAFFSGLKQTICQTFFGGARDDIAGAYQRLRQDIATYYLSIDPKNLRDDFSQTFRVVLGGHEEKFQVKQTLQDDETFDFTFGFDGKPHDSFSTHHPRTFIGKLVAMAVADQHENFKKNYLDQVGALGILNMHHQNQNVSNYWLVREEALIPAVDLLTNISATIFTEEVTSVRVYSNVDKEEDAHRMAFIRKVVDDRQVRLEDSVNRSVVGCASSLTSGAGGQDVVCILQKTTIAAHHSIAYGQGQTMFRQSRPYLFSFSGNGQTIELYGKYAHFVAMAIQDLNNAQAGTVQRVIFSSPSLPYEYSLGMRGDLAQNPKLHQAIKNFAQTVNGLSVPVFFSDKFGYGIADPVVFDGKQQEPLIGEDRQHPIYFLHESFWCGVRKYAPSMEAVNEQYSALGQFQIRDTDMIVRFENPATLVGNNLGRDLSEEGQIISHSTAHAVHAARCQHYHSSTSGKA